ncbi:MAG: high-potential iron-sulfur protein [Sandaracinaceae bacterium]|jgi:hypothetical protein|nr:high-potential iron-sulfur protein [Sandaracinaceae bacterium]
MADKLISRRDLLKKSAFWGIAVVVGPALLNGGCGSDAPVCTDTAGLSQPEIAMRTANAYVDRTPEPAKTCANCNFFESRGESACGGCKVLKGPIAPAGYCRLWAAKIA